tara:strand:+ start:389 stop:613 length:225 start_codon:yes stop_codon:yes gene_type:complete
MNTQPEQLLRQLKTLQLQKKEIEMQITEKKMILEKYYLEGIIMSTFSIDGVKVQENANQKSGNIVILQINLGKI